MGRGIRVKFVVAGSRQALPSATQEARRAPREPGGTREEQGWPWARQTAGMARVCVRPAARTGEEGSL